MDRARFLREEFKHADMITNVSERLEIRARIIEAFKNQEPYDDVIKDIRLIRKRQCEERLSHSIKDLEREITKENEVQIFSHSSSYLRKLIINHKYGKKPINEEEVIAATKDIPFEELQGLIAQAISEMLYESYTMSTYAKQNRNLESRLRKLETERLQLVDMIGKIDEDKCTHITPIKYFLDIV